MAAGIVEVSATAPVTTPAALCQEHLLTLESLSSGEVVANLKRSGAVAADGQAWTLRLDYADVKPGTYQARYTAWLETGGETVALSAMWEPVTLAAGNENAALLTLLPTHRVDGDEDGFFDYEEGPAESDPEDGESLPDDEEPPTFTAQLRVDPVSSATVRVQWSEAARDRHTDEPLLVYEVFAGRDAEQALEAAGDSALARTESEPGYRAVRVEELAPGREYYFTVVARDEAGNRSEPLTPAPVVTASVTVAIEINLSDEDVATALPSPVLAGLARVAWVSLLTSPGEDAYLLDGDDAGLVEATVELDETNIAMVAFAELPDGPADLVVTLGAEGGEEHALVAAWRTVTLNLGAANYLLVTGADFGTPDTDGDSFPDWEEIAGGSDPYDGWALPPDEEPPFLDATLQVEPRGTGALRVAWERPARDRHTIETAMLYEVYVDTQEGEASERAWADTVPDVEPAPDLQTEPGARSVEVTELAPATTYYFSLVAVDEAGNRSAPLDEAAGTTGAAAGVVVVDLNLVEPGRPEPDPGLLQYANAVQAELRPASLVHAPFLPDPARLAGPPDQPPERVLFEFGAMAQGTAELIVTLLHEPMGQGPPEPLAHAARPVNLAPGPGNELQVTAGHFEAHDTDGDGFLDWEEWRHDSDPEDPAALPEDEEPPSFDGLHQATPRGAGTLELVWLAARDRHSPSELVRYMVYHSPDGVELGEPTAQQPLTGLTAVLQTGLAPGQETCFAVRATDEAGNEDNNSVVRCGTPE